MTTLLANSPQSFVSRSSRPGFPRAPRRAGTPAGNGLPTWARLGGPGSSRTEDLVASFWRPGLLEQLQEPVTRYHE
jgi:hypothetical protein